MKKGDVVLVTFPFSDLSGSKLRPALALHGSGDDGIVAFITSVSAPRFTGDIPIAMSHGNGL